MDVRRSTLRILAVATAIGSTGLAAGGTAGPLLVAELAGEGSAGLPLGFLVVGSAASAVLVSWGSARTGRGPALALGYATGALGAVVVVLGGAVESLGVVLGGCLLLGGANAAIFLTRYAAADIAGPGAGARALGTAFFATSLGAIVSPNLLGIGGAAARAFGLPELTGPFALAAPAFAVAGTMIATMSGPRITRLGRGAPLLRSVSPRIVGAREVAAAVRSGSARTSLFVLAATNLVMVAIMAVAPLHLVGHGHGLGLVGFVVSLHVAGMFAPAPLTGRLTDRHGPRTVATVGVLSLLAVGVIGAVVQLDEASVPTIVVYLAVVGLAWNAGIVGGSAMLVAAVPAEVRPMSEGIGEVAMGIAAAVGAPGAGLVFANGGFAALGVGASLVAGLATLSLLAGIGRARPGGRAAASEGHTGERSGVLPVGTPGPPP